ncbi:MAG: hypothetical protein FJY75_08680 [Candidatus Eisenbacteria bacterium]|uniref:DUF6788 domain-containing protein n=1 Tax=Eiseniibacteriota bacterium TaxID=2212470 RepID=A0A937X922_UNCEI|nr:hypothetical protein [Candidatus Eisenbacteria bacterium]
MNRAQMSLQERNWRSRLTRLLHNQGLLRGTLTERRRVCGQPNCRCTRGEKHGSLYLVSHQDGQARQLYIPREREEQARQWSANYRRARLMLDRIAELYFERLQKRR